MVGFGSFDISKLSGFFNEIVIVFKPHQVIKINGLNITAHQSESQCFKSQIAFNLPNRVVNFDKHIPGGDTKFVGLFTV